MATSAAEPTDSSSLFVETAILSAIRCIFILVSRRYVNKFLFADLRSVTEEAYPEGGVLESPTRANIALEEVTTEVGAGGSYGGGGSAAAGGKDGAGLSAPSLKRSNSGGGMGRRDSGTSSPLGGKGMGASQQQVYTKLSTTLFCLSFSESCMLFTLLLFGDAVTDRARSFNWSLSLLTLLSLIVFVIPLGLSLLLTHRKKSTSAARSLILTLIPFAGYLFLFDKVGMLVASKVVVEGSHSLGLVNGMLSRVCVPGVFLIASLSGGGAVNTAWEAYEWRAVASADAVTESQILAAERSLYRARLDLQQRTRSLTLAEGSAAREAESSASQSLLSRWTSASPAASHLKSLQVEVGALEKIESQMVKDVATLKRRKTLREMGRTFKGRVWLAAGWALSVYCVWRVFVSCLNLIVGYSQKHHYGPSTPLDEGEVTTRPEGTDLITSLLSRLALGLNVDIDISMWSRLIGLALIGTIMLANMRAVLWSVSRIFKATSTGVSTSFMLLFLAQLMAMYLLTSLISLPSSPTQSTTTLLDTLPSFSVFSRLFDTVFLIAAGAVFVVRWVDRKMRVDEGVSTQYV